MAVALSSDEEIKEVIRQSIHNFLMENDDHLRLQWEIDKIIFDALREELGIENILVSDMNSLRDGVFNYIGKKNLTFP